MYGDIPMRLLSIIIFSLLLSIPQEVVKRWPVVAAGSGCTSTTCGGLTFKQGCNGLTASGTSVTSVFGPLTAGSVLIVTGGGELNSTTLTVSGCGLTWTNQGTFSGSPSFLQATAPNSGTGSCTVTMSSTATGILPVEGVELAGSSSQLIDVANLVNAGQVTTPSNISGTAIPTTVANDVVVQTVVGWATTGDVYTAGSGAIIYQGTANGLAFAFQWQKKAVAGSVNPNITSDRTDFFIVGNLAVEP